MREIGSDRMLDSRLARVLDLFAVCGCDVVSFYQMSRHLFADAWEVVEQAQL